MSEGYKIEAHPLIPPPSWKEVAAEAAQKGCSEEQALKGLIHRRNDIIEGEQENPLQLGWEPPIWKVCDALLGFSFCDGVFLRQIRARFGFDWNEWAKAMREHLGFKRELTMLLILGGNRSGKSEYAAKRCQLTLTGKEGANVYPFHMSNPRSVRDQQPLFWKYMPPEYRMQTASANEYIKYKRKTGFSENSFINPLGSECAFLNYMQDRDTALEGLEADLMAPDEMIPPDWVETMGYRLSTRRGKAIITFTPVNGYTPTVKIFCDSAVTTKESIGFMAPKDGREPDQARTLGLNEEQFREICRAEIEKRTARAPQSIPEDCNAWLEGRSGQPTAPTDRVFEMMPRVMRSANPEYGVVFFHPSDNPYGNPKDVIQKAMRKKIGRQEIRIRVYGKAEKLISNIFPKFSIRIHVIKPEAIPQEGTNYFFMDPADNRNFFLTWIRACPAAAYCYREWPGAQEIPGIGVPEPWTIPSGKHEGVNDGARGRGQDSFGFGLMRYKFEIARLERWEDYKKWSRDNPAKAYPTDEDLEMWDERHGAEEIMEARYVDSRAASDPRVENDRPVTLYEDLLELGMNFSLAPGAGINDGVAKINSALDYEIDEALSFFNKPHLFISEDCPNTIFALENWMNVDGQKGACKDPIDNLRAYFTGECGYVGAGDYLPRGGFYYGRGGQRPESGGRKSDRPRRRPQCMDTRAEMHVP